MVEFDISVIIPCYNEKEFLNNMLQSLVRELVKSQLRYEIIFCDNGSNDGSIDIAKQFSLHLFNSVSKTVAGVRNDGVSVSRGKVLIFLDADIIVGNDWGREVNKLYHRVVGSKIIIGTHPTFADTVSPILRPWYTAISNDMRNTHLGTGHMMISSANFHSIGGFDDSLVTGEDYDFCVKAKQFGVSIVTESRLVVCHVGYPDNVIDFAKREMWHGEGDFANFNSMMKSKVALASLCFSLLLFFAAVMMFFNIFVSFVLVALALLLATAVQYYKFGFISFMSSIVRSYVSCIYLFSRSLSPFLIMIKKLQHC
jgi:glycosyltransferase involved in cell wall biosynthesis